MDKENSNKKLKRYETNHKERFAIAIAYILFLGVGVAVCFDHVYYGQLNCTIAQLSVDSVISVVAITASIVFSFLASRTSNEYQLNRKDYKCLKIISTDFYINLLILSVLLMLFDIFFYIFNFRISLTASIGVTIIYLLVFIIPITGSFATQTRNFYKLARKGIQKLHKKSDPNSKIYESFFSSNNTKYYCISSLNKFMNTIVLKNGIEETITGIYRDKHSDSAKAKNEVNRNDLYIYLICLQDFYLRNLLSGDNQDVALNDNSIGSYVRNLNHLCNSPYLQNIIDCNDIKKVLINKFVDSSNNLEKIIELMGASDVLLSEFYDIVLNLLDSINVGYFTKTFGKSFDDIFSFKFNVLYSLFFSSFISEKSLWYLKALSHCINNQLSCDFYYNHTMSILLIVVEFIYEEQFNLDSEFFNKIKFLFKGTFGIYIENILNSETSPFYSQEYLSLCNYIDCCQKQFKEYWYFDNTENKKDYSYNPSIVKFASDLNGFLAYLRLFKHRNEADYFIDKLAVDKQKKEYFLSYRNIMEMDDYKWISGIYSCLVNLEICTKNDNLKNELKKFNDYLFGYENRKERLRLIKNEMKFDYFKKQMNLSFSKLDGFLKPDPMVDSDLSDAKIIFIARSNEKLVISSDGTFKNPNHIIDRLFSTNVIAKSGINWIRDYTQPALDLIIKLEPKFKYAPNFDAKYKTSKNQSLKNIAKMKPSYAVLSPNDRYEIFMSDAPLDFYIRLDGENVRLILPEDLDESNVHSYEESYNQALKSLGLSKSKNKKIIFEEIAKNYVLVELNFKYKINIHYDTKNLIFSFYHPEDLKTYLKMVE